MGMKATGLDVLGAGLAAAAAEVTVTAGAAVQQVAQGIASDARANAPVLTGELRSDIQVSGSGLSATVEDFSEHAPYVEYGTSRMAAQPYLGPAVAGNVNNLMAAVGKAGEQAMPQ